MLEVAHIRAMGAELRKLAGPERVLFKGTSLLGIKTPAQATAAKLTTPKIPSPKTQKFGITTSK